MKWIVVKSALFEIVKIMIQSRSSLALGGSFKVDLSSKVNKHDCDRLYCQHISI